MGWLALVARLVVGGVWVRTGLAGLREPVDYTVPAVELVIGLALVVGVMSRGAAAISVAISAVLLGASALGLASADPREIVPVVALLAASAWLVRVGPGRLALDTALAARLARRRTPAGTARAQDQLDRDPTRHPEGVD